MEQHSIDMVRISTGSFANDVEIAAKSMIPCIVNIPNDNPCLTYFRDILPKELQNFTVNARHKDGTEWTGSFREIWNDAIESSDKSDLYMTDMTLGMFPGNCLKMVPSVLVNLNVLRHLTPRERPDWFWYMVGGRGTFTPRHIDTGMSAAWNLLLQGQKEWTFGNTKVALNEKRIPPGVLSESQDEVIVRFTQSPGDIVFTPSGWVHEVYNTQGSTALTGNFINSVNIDNVTNFWSAIGEKGVVDLINSVRPFTVSGD